MTNHFDLNKLNAFLDSATEAISCGPECQTNKKAEQLKNVYVNAESNLLLAEPQYEIAKKNYFTFVKGEGQYNEMLENELKQKVDKILNNYNISFDEAIKNIKMQLDSYYGLEINYKNVVDLHQQYKKENRRLFEKLKKDTNDIVTNDRKTYYEDQQIELLNTYYSYLFWFVYVICVVFFIIFSLFYPTQTSFKSRILLIGLFFLLPFISTWLLGKLIQIVNLIFSLLPKNVYK